VNCMLGLELIGFYKLWNGKNIFLMSLLRRLPRIKSNHFPLMSDCGVSSGGTRYFKFENFWRN
jgi:hypothetical protein